MHGLGYLIRKINREDSLLIVDDVFDTGLSIDAVFDHLTQRTRRNTPHDIRVATPWFKPSKNKTTIIPDFYLHESAQWLVFPHELDGLSKQEIIDGKGQLASILQSVSCDSNPLK